MTKGTVLIKINLDSSKPCGNCGGKSYWHPEHEMYECPSCQRHALIEHALRAAASSDPENERNWKTIAAVVACASDAATLAAFPGVGETVRWVRYMPGRTTCAWCEMPILGHERADDRGSMHYGCRTQYEYEQVCAREES